MAYHAIEAAKTHCPHGHEFTPENTYEEPKTGWRHCVVCRKQTDRKKRVRRYKTSWYLKKRYGMTHKEYSDMLIAQDGLCAICYEEPATHVDHDHSSGSVRGLLCTNCNMGLGQFKDNADALAAAADYVRG